MGRRDSNPRISIPKTEALPLGDAPTEISITAYVDGIIALNFLVVKGVFWVFMENGKNYLLMCFVPCKYDNDTAKKSLAEEILKKYDNLT